MKSFRIGMGYDVHKLVAGRPCKIGGVLFDFAKGPLGHSDGDVLLHAICDALLGALSLGDIGDHFAPDDDRYKDMDSKIMLKDCYQMVLQKGYRINNLDTVIVCEAPKIKPKREDIQNTVSSLLECDADLVSIKAVRIVIAKSMFCVKLI